MKWLFEKILGETMCSFDMGTIQNIAEKYGYDVTANVQHVTIKKKRSLASIAGFPPLYYFKGGFEQAENQSKVTGRILMASIPKVVLIVWWALLLFAFVASVGMALVLAVKFMFFSPENIQPQLARVGLFLGATFMLGIFGMIVTGFIKAISKKQRGQLIDLCNSGSRGANSTVKCTTE